MAEQELSRRLTELARDIHAGESFSEAAEEIVAATVDLLAGASGAGVTLASRRQPPRTVAATSELVREGDRLQYELMQGPCLDAAWEHELVYSPDLDEDERWRAWGPRVSKELGAKSMLCVQLFTNDTQLGALNIYSETPDAFDAEDCDIAQMLAAHTAVAVAAAQEIETLKVAVDRRTTIGKALGILMARYGLSDDQAMSTLRRLSSHQNRKLYDIALDVVHDARLISEDGE